MLRRLNIRSKLLLTVAVPLVFLLGVALVAFPTFQTVKVNGPQYKKLAALADLRADVLPPPQYLVETHLEASRILLSVGNPSIPFDYQATKDRLATLENQYRTRHEYWNNLVKDDELKQSLLVDSYAAANDYFRQLNGAFVPRMDSVVKSGWLRSSGQLNLDFEAAKRVYETNMNKIYNQHRAGIDQVVERTDTLTASTENNVRKIVQNRLVLLSLTALLASLVAALIGATVARAISRPIRKLIGAANQAATQELPRVVAEVQKSDNADLSIAPITVDSGDELGELASAFNSMQNTAVALASEQARVRRNVSENLVNLGRRNQVLLGRTLSFVSQLEDSERDPKRLDDLFRLDHLTTRMRRNAESLLVLAGNEQARLWSEPIDIGDVVRAALSEIEEYHRVELTGIESARLQGASVTDVAHLLAELLENATSFSPPTSKVSVLGKRRSDGYLIVIVDEGFGMTKEEMEVFNRRIAEPAAFDATPSKVLGLQVVGKLALRHAIRVELTESFAIGVAARILLPDALFDDQSLGRSDSPSIVAAPAAAELNGAAPLPTRALEDANVDGLESPLDEPFTAVGDGFSDVLIGSPSESDAASVLGPAASVAVESAVLVTVPEQPAEPPTTAAGLKRRVPGAQLPDTGPAADTSADQTRDPSVVRSMLGGLQRGVEGARRLADDQD